MGAPNADMREHWDKGVGQDWVTQQGRLDALLEPLGQLALAALGEVKGRSLLDIGCGCGASTLAAASLVGPEGHVTGVDVSQPMLDRANERVVELGLTARVELRLADAQQADLGERSFDGAMSRLGVMFFDDASLAFGNIRTALRVGASLAFVCWRDPGLNPWFSKTSAAAARHIEIPPPPPAGTPGPFGLADDRLIEETLTSAGFGSIEACAVDEPMMAGTRLEDAVALALSIGPVARAVSEVKPTPSRLDALADALGEALEPYAGDDGVRVPGGVWVVSARRLCDAG